MKIELCDACEGTGEIRENVGTHQSEYEYHTCTKCNGTGRVLTGSYRYKVPSDIDKNIIYKYDSEIVKLIRELQSKK